MDPDTTPAPPRHRGGAGASRSAEAHASGAPLGPDATGEAVADLQRRLRGLGHRPGENGRFGKGTTAAVEAFQAASGLHVDGICGPQTWNALVEAGWRLGDRLLYDRRPMLRGDDVSTLQSRLGTLGFHADRVDGILGPRTAGALTDFQRNSGLTADGICGPETVAALDRLGARSPSAVKGGLVERERLRTAPRQLHGRRVLVGDSGGLGALAASVERVLQDLGAIVLVAAHPDGSAQAAQANRFEAEAVVGLTVARGLGSRCAYYATEGFESHGGRRLATLLVEGLGAPDMMTAPATTIGMRLPVLRETRMPAVVCELAPARAVVEQSAAVAWVVGAAIRSWAASPLEG